MKTVIFALFLLLFSLPAQATYVPNSSAQATIGQAINSQIGAISAPLSDWVGTGSYTRMTLLAADTTSTDAGFYGFSIQGGSTGHYKVTTNKTLYCLNLNYTNQGSQHYLFGYSSVDFTEGSGTVVSGQQYFAESGDRFHGWVLAATTFGKFDSKPVFFKFPGDSYPNMELGKDGLESWSLIFDCLEK